MFENEFDDVEDVNNNEEDIQSEETSEKPAKTKKAKAAKSEPEVEAAPKVEEETVPASEPELNEQLESPAAEEVVMPEDNELQLGEGSKNGTVTVQPVKFASFDNLNQISGEENKNLDILMDVKLKLNVELGRCELPIKKVLELTRGSIIELDKVAGEPVELYANGKLIALGEVVVIDDNFGLRITSITDPDERIN